MGAQGVPQANWLVALGLARTWYTYVRLADAWVFLYGQGMLYACNTHATRTPQPCEGFLNLIHSFDPRSTILLIPESNYLVPRLWRAWAPSHGPRLPAPQLICPPYLPRSLLPSPSAQDVAQIPQPPAPQQPYVIRSHTTKDIGYRSGQ